MLYLVPTPIGNLSDITLRAIEVLREVDFILAEDTRTSGILMKHLDISKPLHAFHQHNEHRVLDKVVDRLKAGETAALVSDAGTPGISDPGFLMVRECLREGVDIICLPGPTAFIPALVCSGLPCERFVFEGFLPHKKGRHTRLTTLQEESRTMVFYESPHRLLKTLLQFSEYFGEDRQASVSREISKVYEETVRGTLIEIHTHFETNPLKGEFVIVVAGC
ncbi:MAG TPA: 16S rRNA (cytidine(1402)-2'-O)-methyltransferase [Bacteroidales bacterium]|nr:16S rRNA (cytidine(1402)-2'-O)-methyltransferase [Bacteroidales bacterium]